MNQGAWKIFLSVLFLYLFLDVFDQPVWVSTYCSDKRNYLFFVRDVFGSRFGASCASQLLADIPCLYPFYYLTRNFLVFFLVVEKVQRVRVPEHILLPRLVMIYV